MRRYLVSGTIGRILYRAEFRGRSHQDAALAAVGKLSGRGFIVDTVRLLPESSRDRSIGPVARSGRRAGANRPKRAEREAVARLDRLFGNR